MTDFKLDAFWQFSRPHTIIGTTLSVLAIYAIALSHHQTIPTLESLGGLLLTLFACLCGNVYIVGLNQLEDIEIDRINKPHLPLASGEFSRQEGVAIVRLTGVLAVLAAAWGGLWLWVTVGISLAIGTAYSLPPVRLKRFPFWAAFCIFTVRGVVVNLGLFLHFNGQLGGVPGIPLTVWVLTAFIVLFTVAIALFKDVPDLEGDKQYNIQTFTLILGKAAILKLSLLVISLCYLGMILIAVARIAPVNAEFLFSSHVILLISLWWRSQQIQLSQKRAIAQFYQFIWKLFFLEYLLFPLACLLV
ncbi:homogentisate phytyltransferase [Spirulina subsalsa FACHB-351]|uniref:Homogentisate phytyltransferase n=1 Tax=Spirulina subsalsa FACHB-351 TaxID=234711 RepID=A0ABT3L5X3_9CYAN|nr:homogentisate phytyltransferase [Spirulina subsalsa]MCW6036899.1 homogentisate phytyltransferase [Spirulina subsalsa FACHB-351]